ncbi:MAG: glycosyltransferase family 2 protein [Pseudomonadota bacterium]
MELSIVIPVYNCADDLAANVERIISDVAADFEVILVDDKSTDASRQVIEILCETHERVSAVLLDENGGAGLARVAGFAEAKGEYTLFFDADDQIVEGSIDKCLFAIRSEGADALVASYHYGQSISEHSNGMHRRDEEIFSTVLGKAETVIAHMGRTPELASITAYPWNKIIATQPFRDNGLFFSATPVHNDIYAHWHIMMLAKKLVVTRTPLCIHIVEQGKGNITNIADKRRLEIFTALEDVERLFEDRPWLKRRYYNEFLEFKMNLVEWAVGRVPLAHRAEFARRYAESCRRITVLDYNTLASPKFDVAGRMRRWMNDPYGLAVKDF